MYLSRVSQLSVPHPNKVSSWTPTTILRLVTSCWQQCGEGVLLLF